MIDPIKQVENDIVDFLNKNRGTTMSGFEIRDGLNKYAFEHVHEALGYLLDQKRVNVRNQKYVIV